MLSLHLVKLRNKFVNDINTILSDIYISLGGIEGLSRAGEMGDVLPEGIDRTEENYKREILKLRIENERLKKNYTVQKTEDGQTVFIRLSPKNSK